jgi:hypothetical protein
MILVRCLMILALSLALAGCNSAPRKVRYRLTIDISVDGAIKEGSSVGEITFGVNDGLLKNMGSYYWSACKCEAAAIDLGQRGLLFAGLAYYRKGFDGVSPFASLISGLFPETKHVGWEPAAVDALARHVGPVDIDVDNLPVLVQFRDISDLRSVVRVDPEHLDASFGPGVKFAHATMEIVDSPLTTGIEKRLPWWNGPITAGYLTGTDGLAHFLVDQSLFRSGSD